MQYARPSSWRDQQEPRSLSRVTFAGGAGSCMRQKDHKTSLGALKREEVTELQKLLQTDNIAPADRATFGRRLAEIIIRVRNLSKRRQRK